MQQKKLIWRETGNVWFLSLKWQSQVNRMIFNLMSELTTFTHMHEYCIASVNHSIVHVFYKLFEQLLKKIHIDK